MDSERLEIVTHLSLPSAERYRESGYAYAMRNEQPSLFQTPHLDTKCAMEKTCRIAKLSRRASGE